MKSASPANVDEYISTQPNELKPILNKLRAIIRKTAPKAEEVISYGMPGYKQNGMLIWFAGFKNHYSLFPKSNLIKVFKDELKDYELSKGTIRFELSKAIPEKLIKDIVKYRIKENEELAASKKVKSAKTVTIKKTTTTVKEKVKPRSQY